MKYTTVALSTTKSLANPSIIHGLAHHFVCNILQLDWTSMLSPYIMGQVGRYSFGHDSFLNWLRNESIIDFNVYYGNRSIPINNGYVNTDAGLVTSYRIACNESLTMALVTYPATSEIMSLYSDLK